MVHQWYRDHGNGAGTFFVLLNSFVLFSLARFGFPKKPDEKQRINKVHPNQQ